MRFFSLSKCFWYSNYKNIVSLNLFKYFKRIFKLEKLLITGSGNEAGLSRGGRNNQGRITIRSRGGFRWRVKNRFVDFWRRLNYWGFLFKYVRDPRRSSLLGLIVYRNGLISFLLIPELLKIGECVFTGDSYQNSKDIYIQRFFKKKFYDRTKNNGDTFLLKNISIGTLVYNVEIFPRLGGQLIRSAGVFGILISKDTMTNTVVLKLNSGWKVILSSNCLASVGVVQNIKHNTFSLKKAGIVRLLGRRPKVRGVAMNAVDHPHGGGRGKTSGGTQPLSPWGWITKARKTVSKKKRLLKKYRSFK